MTDTSIEAVSKRLCAFAWDYPCVHCGSPVLEKNSRDQIICCGCLNENPRDERSEAIMDALALIDRLSAERDALRAALDSNAAIEPAPADDWPDIPDTPEQRELIAKHNADIRAKYPDLVQIDPAPVSVSPDHSWEPVSPSAARTGEELRRAMIRAIAEGKE
jgi:hypothetical protein